jgi:hypothetical protein
MTAVSAPTRSRPRPGARRPALAEWRLLRLELRRSAMLWLIPVAVALFWYDAYRNAMAAAPLWNVRAMTMQHGALLDFVPPVVGAAAWMGSREGRRRTTDLMAIAAKPRWVRQLATWGAVTLWAMLAYLGCVAVMYVMIARQAAWGGPLWWPALVGAAGIPAVAAVGFAAGSICPSRFTTPVVTVGTFFAIGLGSEAAHSNSSIWQLSPPLVGSFDIGPDSGLGTFYRYLPDLSIAQVMFMAGLAVAVIGGLGLPERSGGRFLRGSAAVLTAVGLLTSGTAIALVGTARLDPRGMLVIPALHDAANDRPIRYTPVCGHTAIPVCLNPAYAAYLPVVTAALEPVISEVAGLPGAPARISQSAPIYAESVGNSVGIGSTGILALPDQLPSLPISASGTVAAQFAAQVRAGTAVGLVASVVPSFVRVDSPVGREGRSQGILALQAVRAALLKDAFVQLSGGGPVPRGGIIATSGLPVPGPAPGTAVYAAARRFAALPASVRHAWLVQHLAALRAGHITLAQLP